MTVAKVYYYSATGRAHQIRLALAAANIEFEDVFPTCGYPPSQEQVLEWRKLGKNTTTNIPMLEMPDGKVYTQSSAVMLAIGRIGNLLPSCDDDMYKTYKLMADCEDFRSLSYQSMWGAPKEAYERFVYEQMPVHFENFQRQLLENSNGDGGYIVVKDRLTLADVAVYDAVVNYGANRAPSDCLDKFPQLAQWVRLVETHPRISHYLKSEQFAKIEMKFSRPEHIDNEEEKSRVR